MTRLERSMFDRSELVRAARHAFRSLGRAPVFTASAILLLAIGIGSTTATYSVVDAAIFRPLPYPASDRLVTVANVDLPYDFGGRAHKPRAYPKDLEQLGVFSSVATYAVGAMNLGTADAVRRASVAYVTRDFFRTFGRAPLLGRSFIDAESESVGDFHVAILSHRLWMQEFGGEQAVLGRQFTLNGRQFRAIGVMPADFAYPSDPDLWLPFPLPISSPEVFEPFGFFIPATTVARLHSSVSIPTANTAVSTLERQYPSWAMVSDSSARALVTPLQSSLLATRTRSAIIALSVASAFVLLIALANLAALLSARSAHRRNDLDVRILLGASRGQLLGQPIAEALILSAAGTLGGVIIAALSLKPLSALLPSSLLAVAPPALDVRLLAFAILASVGVAVSITIALGVIVSREAKRPRSIAGGRVTPASRARMQEMLVVAEVALALFLVVGAGLTVETLRRLVGVDTGLHETDAVVARVSLPRATYPTPQATAQVFENSLERISSDPGVRAAGAIDILPLTGGLAFGTSVTAPQNPVDSIYPLSYSVTPGYFAAAGIPVLRGRDFSWTDRPGEGVVVNMTAARRLWPDGNGVGRQVLVGDRTRTVVGIVGNVRTRRLADTAVAQLYVPLSENGGNAATLIVSATMPLERVASRIRDAVHAVDPALPVYDVQRIDDVLAAAVVVPRTASVLLAVFSAIALVLAGVGAYGLSAYNVDARRREFAVRLAVGAAPFDLFARILRRTAALAAIGVTIGFGIAALGVRLAASRFFGIQDSGMSVFLTAGAVLAATVVAGALVPALHAMRTDPIEGLRAE
jgi:putative ABC transport system permease protein